MSNSADIKVIKINGVDYVPASEAVSKPVPLSGRVIVRCRDAGVHVGTLIKKEGDTVLLKDSNRLFYFKSATKRRALFSLSEVAMQGVCRKESKIGALLPEITLRDWCEIIPVKEGVDLTEVNND